MAALGDFFTNLGTNVGTGIANTFFGSLMAEHNAKVNYKYNEMAANKADSRTRALYGDFMSPAARISQLKDAGLSPSIYADGAGAGAQGVTAGAQGAGASGIGGGAGQISPVDMANIRLANAQANKADAETNNINKDTDIKALQEKLQSLQLGNAQIAWNITNSTWTNPKTGKATSLFEMAQGHYTYESFLQEIRENEGSIDPTIYRESQTEEGQKTLREIYKAASTFNRDIMVLSSDTVSASFQIALTDELSKAGFAQQNAATVIAELKAAKAAADLTEQQKNAWNDLLDKLGKKGSTTRDIVIVLGMILANFASRTSVGIKVTQ